MEYKEKYEMALERARVWKEKSGMPADKQGILDDIFPELAESEDEKIKKALIEMVHDTTGDELWVDYNVHKEEVLAWLEKQDPKKHEEELEKAYKTADKVQYRRGYEAATKEMEKQGEQKPAVEMKTPEESLGIDSDIYNEIVDKCIYGEQKSQRMISAEAKEAMYAKTTWSEEDEKMLADACIMLDWYQGNNWWKAQHIKNWLKSLKERIG